MSFDNSAPSTLLRATEQQGLAIFSVLNNDNLRAILQNISGPESTIKSGDVIDLRSVITMAVNLQDQNTNIETQQTNPDALGFAFRSTAPHAVGAHGILSANGDLPESVRTRPISLDGKERKIHLAVYATSNPHFVPSGRSLDILARRCTSDAVVLVCNKDTTDIRLYRIADLAPLYFDTPIIHCGKMNVAADMQTLIDEEEKLCDEVNSKGCVIAKINNTYLSASILSEADNTPRAGAEAVVFAQIFKSGKENKNCEISNLHYYYWNDGERTPNCMGLDMLKKFLTSDTAVTVHFYKKWHFTLPLSAAMPTPDPDAALVHLSPQKNWWRVPTYNL